MSDINEVHDIIMSWQERYDTRKAMSKQNRIEIMCHLLYTLQLHGYDKKYLDENKEIKTKIIKACVGGARNDKSLRIWTTMVADNLESAIYRVYPKEIVEYDSSKFKKVEIAGVEKQSSNFSSEKENDFEEEYKMHGTPFNKSILDKLPKPEVIYDSEMRKFLGFEDNE